MDTAPETPSQHLARLRAPRAAAICRRGRQVEPEALAEVQALLGRAGRGSAIC